MTPKKQLILESAIDLFANQGFEATTVQQITAHCGISKGAFYLAFPSKDALIVEMIDYFMKSITAQIDQSVKATQDDEEKLFVYFKTTFTSLSQYAEFARILLFENFALTGDQILQKVMYYEQLADALLEEILKAIYGQRIELLLYELVLLVKSFIKAYTFLLFTPGQQLDLVRLSESLVEKTTILATHSKMAYLSYPSSRVMHNAPLFTKEQLREELEQLSFVEMTSLAKESVALLLEELQLEKVRPALLMGMLANLQQEPKAAWCCYMLRNYVMMDRAV